jgi:hypothetical protein
VIKKLAAASCLLVSVALALPKEPPKEPAFYATPKVVANGSVIEIGIGDSLKNTLKGAQPGDVVLLHSGTYPASGGLEITRSGTADAWVVLKGKPGTRPVIDLNGGELHIGASYVLLENLEVVNGTGNNIHIIPDNARTPISNIILKNVRSAEMARGTGAALKIAGNWRNGHGVPTEQVYVEGCELTGSRDNALVDAVAVRKSVVRNCWIHDAVRISMKNPGIFFKGGSSDILIEKNLISGIRGNAAVMIGGDTDKPWFDALYVEKKLEGANQVVRNNIICDCDDAVFEVRGAKGVKIFDNTVVTASAFAIFRFTWGGGGSGEKIGNDDVEIANNLVVATKGPKFALNDGNEDMKVKFGPQLWAGRFSRAEGRGLPRFPGDRDVSVGSGDEVLVSTDDTKLKGLADALERFRPARGSPALKAGSPVDACPRDIMDVVRSTTAPSIGAFESDAKPKPKK